MAEDVREGLSTLLQTDEEHYSHQTLVAEQAKDPEVQQLITFIEQGRLAPEEDKARKMTLLRSLFTVVEGVLYYVDPKRDN